MAGTEGGSLFKCLMDHNEAMCNDFNSHVAENNVPKLRTPIKADYSGHTGPVHDIHCSPFQVLFRPSTYLWSGWRSRGSGVCTGQQMTEQKRRVFSYFWGASDCL